MEHAAASPSCQDDLGAAKRAIDVLGGPVAAARVLNVQRYQTIQSWLTHQVPVEHCPLIEKETSARGKAITCEDLRPDVVWQRIEEDGWPEGKPLVDVAPGLLLAPTTESVRG